ncbi:MAG: TfoX/Sxy family protein [Pseudomonadota bacterium]
MPTPVSSIRNIGPAMETAFHAAGFNSAEDLRAAGPDAAYKALLQSGHRPHFIAFYALVMGMQGRPWNDCQGKEKEELRARFDSLVSTTKATPKSDIARELDALGIRIDAPLSPSDKK